MGFDKIWNHLLAKKPALADDEATFKCSVANFRTLLRQVYDQGYEHGKQQMGEIDGLFENIFKERR